MGSIFYEFEPVQNGCILNLKDNLLLPLSKRLEVIRQEMLQSGEIKPKKQNINKRVEVRPNSMRKTKNKRSTVIRQEMPQSGEIKPKEQNINKRVEVRPNSMRTHTTNNKRSTFIELRNTLSNLIRTSRESSDFGSQVTLKERQIFWDTMLNIGKWLNIGNDFKTNREYEILLDNIGSCEPVKLSLSKSNEYFWEEKSLNPLRDSAGDRCLIRSINDNDNRSYNYNNYIYIDDIIPGTSKPIPGVLAAEVDLQACNLALEELVDKTRPFDTKAFVELIEAGCPETKVKTLLKMETIGGNVLDIKKNLTRSDWESIKDLYIEFKSKGVIEMHKISDKILSIASKCYPRVMAHDWMVTTGMTNRLTALKLGAFFLNIFHVFYIFSAQEDEELVKDKNRSVHQSNKVNELRLLPSQMLNLYIKTQYRHSTENKNLVNKALTMKPEKKKTSTIQAKNKPTYVKRNQPVKPPTAKKKFKNKRNFY